MSYKEYIPWTEPVYWGKEREYILEALDSSWISGGYFVDKLESQFVNWTSCQNALAVSNGTSALQLAFIGASISPGDEIIVPGFCFLAAANVALNMGAIPVFADVDPNTWCITAGNIEKVITSKTKAVIAVHTYGNSCEMDKIVDLCSKGNICVIEDVAESLGTKYKGKLTGTFGDINCFSFQATKTITTGEGGMVLTKDNAIAERMRLYRSHGMGKTRYFHDVPGLNFRLTNIQAALGCAQFEKIEDIIEARKRVYLKYKNILNSADGVELQQYSSNVDPVVWAISIKLSTKFFPNGRDKIIDNMLKLNIETRPGFYPASSMKHIYRIKDSDIPIAKILGNTVISLPSSPNLTEEMIEYICNTILNMRKK
jgi:perosamine synthetase